MVQTSFPNLLISFELLQLFDVTQFERLKYGNTSPDFGPVPPDGVPGWLDGAAKPAHGRLEKDHRHQGTVAGAQNETNQRWHAGPLLPGLRSPHGPGRELCGEHSGYLRPATAWGGRGRKNGDDL